MFYWMKYGSGVVVYHSCKNLPYICSCLCICRIRVPYPFQWGAPSFDAGEAFAMMVTSFVALVEVCLVIFVSLGIVNVVIISYRSVLCATYVPLI